MSKKNIVNKKMTALDTSGNLIYNQIREILTAARAKAYSAVNFAMEKPIG